MERMPETDPSLVEKSPGDAGRRVTGPRRELFVYAAIAVTTILIVSMIGILCWRWITSTEPAVLLIEGTPDFQGVVVHVKSKPPGSSQVVKFTRENAYKPLCYLAPGVYELTVSSDTTTLLKRDIVIQNTQPRRWDLTGLLSATTQP